MTIIHDGPYWQRWAIRDRPDAWRRLPRAVVYHLPGERPTPACLLDVYLLASPSFAPPRPALAPS